MAVKLQDGETQWDKELVERWVARLGLNDWHIRLAPRDEKLSEETQAATQIQAPYKEAMITTGPNFPSDLDEQELVIVHELCHILTAPMARAGENITQAAASSARDALHDLFSDSEEKVVTRLSTLFLNRMGSARNA